MTTVRITGEVDQEHRLTVTVPSSIPPGSVEVVLISHASGEDDAGLNWAKGIAQEWHQELSDPREDIYTLDDGKPIHGSR